MLVLLALAGSAWAKERVWTDAQGRTMKAEFIREIDGEVTFLKDGKLMTVPLDRLSEKDQKIIRDLADGKPLPEDEPAPAPEAKSLPDATPAAGPPAGTDSDAKKSGEAKPASSTGPKITIENRTWTDSRGQQTTAKFVRINGSDVVLNRLGKIITVSYHSLSADDQQYIRDVLTQQGKESLIPSDRPAPAPNTGNAGGGAPSVPPDAPSGTGPRGAGGMAGMGPGMRGPGMSGPGMGGPGGIGGPGIGGPGIGGPGMGQGPGMGAGLSGVGPPIGHSGPGMGGAPPRGPTSVPGGMNGPIGSPYPPTGPSGIGGGSGMGPGMGPGMGSGMGPGMGSGMGPGMGSGMGSGMGPGMGPGMGAGGSPFPSGPSFPDMSQDMGGGIPGVPTFRQTYQCSGCKREISEAQSSLDKCPHCGTYWVYKSDASGAKTYNSNVAIRKGIGIVIAVIVVVVLGAVGGFIGIIAAVVKAVSKPARPTYQQRW